LGEQAFGTSVRIGTIARMCVANQVFGERLRDCSPFSSSSKRLHLLPGAALSSSDRFRLLPDGHSRVARRASSCTDCGPRLRATHHKWVWSHLCLEHGSLHRVHLYSQIG
jgi:hypothetical protein